MEMPTDHQLSEEIKHIFLQKIDCQYLTVSRTLSKHFFALPVKHCMLNSIRLPWFALNNYVRDKTVNFSLSDVRRLTYR
jgi:hypothetical protein